jgi:UDP-N-acetylmuramoylalanine--D-glutamate ligase
VVGLGRSGRAAARVLRARGERVIAVDAGAPDVAELASAGVELALDEDGSARLAEARAVIKSPGVPASAPAIAGARERALPVLGELELAWRLLENEFVAVTGTNGKTTTAELLGHLHRQAGVPVAVAGNVGTAASSLVGELDPAAVVVCETSSFQLEDTQAFAPEAAVLLNVSEDHLDRHGTLDAYVAAKLRAFANQGPEALSVAPCALDVGPLPGSARRLCFGSGPDADMAVRDGVLVWRGEQLMAASDVRLRGAHNLDNAMAAAAVALARGLDPDAVRAGLASFPGVAHRLEEVAERRGVLYVNDSKATNVASTLVALRAFEPGTIHLILGGQGKGQDFRALRDPVAAAARSVLLIGEDAPRIGAALKHIAPRVTQCGDLERALAAARRGARRGDVILLSPACASLDRYEDFEARGEHFRALVRGSH